MGGGLLLASSPWLSTFAEVDHTINYKVRLGIIGPGSRGCFLLNFIQKNPKVEIVGICDIYQKSIDNALKIAPKAKVYKDYRALLDSNGCCHHYHPPISAQRNGHCSDGCR